eukprot:jgi/Mesvir1/8229/Mv12514-RA.1
MEAPRIALRDGRVPICHSGYIPPSESEKSVRPKVCSPSFLVMAVCVLCLGVALSVWLAVSSERSRTNDVHISFERGSKDLANIMRSDIGSHQELLSLAATRISPSNPTLSLEDFEHIASHVVGDRDWILAIEWVPRVRQQDREFAESLAAMSYNRSGLEFTERLANGAFVPAGNRSDYFPIFYLQPYLGNEAVLGYDLASSKVRRKFMTESADQAAIVATGRIRLIQETATGFGFLLLCPVYAAYGAGDRPRAWRRNNLIGFLVGVYRLQSLLETFLGDKIADIERTYSNNVRVALYDAGAPPGTQFLAQRSLTMGPEDAAAWESSRPEQTARSAAISRSYAVNVGGHQWTLVVTATWDVTSQFHRRMIMTVVVGSLCSVLGATLLATVQWHALKRSQTEQLRELTRHLLESKRRAERATQRVVETMNFICHEVRNPLHAAMGMVSLLKEASMAPQEQGEVIRDMESALGFLHRIVNDVLDLNKITSGRMEFEHAPFKLRRMLEDVRRNYGATATRLGIAWSVTVDSDVPDVLVGDEGRLQQCMANLLGNAFRFVKAGYVRVHVSPYRGQLDGGQRVGGSPGGPPLDVRVHHELGLTQQATTLQGNEPGQGQGDCARSADPGIVRELEGDLTDGREAVGTPRPPEPVQPGDAGATCLGDGAGTTPDLPPASLSRPPSSAPTGPPPSAGHGGAPVRSWGIRNVSLGRGHGHSRMAASNLATASLSFTGMGVVSSGHPGQDEVRCSPHARSGVVGCVHGMKGSRRNARMLHPRHWLPSPSCPTPSATGNGTQQGGGSSRRWGQEGNGCEDGKGAGHVLPAAGGSSGRGGGRAQECNCMAAISAGSRGGFWSSPSSPMARVSRWLDASVTGAECAPGCVAVAWRGGDQPDCPYSDPPHVMPGPGTPLSRRGVENDIMGHVGLGNDEAFQAPGLGHGPCVATAETCSDACGLPVRVDAGCGVGDGNAGGGVCHPGSPLPHGPGAQPGNVGSQTFCGTSASPTRVSPPLHAGGCHAGDCICIPRRPGRGHLGGSNRDVGGSAPAMSKGWGVVSRLAARVARWFPLRRWFPHRRRASLSILGNSSLSSEGPRAWAVDERVTGDSGRNRGLGVVWSSCSSALASISNALGTLSRRGHQMHSSASGGGGEQHMGSGWRIRNAVGSDADGDVVVGGGIEDGCRLDGGGDGDDSGEQQVLLLVSVQDSGMGIAPEILPALGEAFKQADASIARQFGGSGLGLSIVKGLTRQMQGELFVSSTLGKGSEFSFTARFGLPPAPTSQLAAAPQDLGGTGGDEQGSAHLPVVAMPGSSRASARAPPGAAPGPSRDLSRLGDTSRVNKLVTASSAADGPGLAYGSVPAAPGGGATATDDVGQEPGREHVDVAVGVPGPDLRHGCAGRGDGDDADNHGTSGDASNHGFTSGDASSSRDCGDTMHGRHAQGRGVQTVVIGPDAATEGLTSILGGGDDGIVGDAKTCHVDACGHHSLAGSRGERRVVGEASRYPLKAACNRDRDSRVCVATGITSSPLPTLSRAKASRLGMDGLESNPTIPATQEYVPCKSGTRDTGDGDRMTAYGSADAPEQGPMPRASQVPATNVHHSTERPMPSMKGTVTLMDQPAGIINGPMEMGVEAPLASMDRRPLPGAVEASDPNAAAASDSMRPSQTLTLQSSTTSSAPPQPAVPQRQEQQQQQHVHLPAHPLASHAPMDAHACRSQEPAALAPPARLVRILVVEDAPLIQKLMQRFLAALVPAPETDFAENGLDACRLVLGSDPARIMSADNGTHGNTVAADEDDASSRGTSSPTHATAALPIRSPSVLSSHDVYPCVGAPSILGHGTVSMGHPSHGLSSGNVPWPAVAVTDERTCQRGIPPYDLILMDLNMPGMSGVQACRRIRAAGVVVPVVALTGNAMTRDRQLCAEAGFDGFLPKPFSKDQLLAMVNAVLQGGTHHALFAKNLV